MDWTTIGSHPFAVWREFLVGGRRMIECFCRLQGCTEPHWEHLCIGGPARRNQWLLHFAMLHSHGMVPVRQIG